MRGLKAMNRYEKEGRELTNDHHWRKKDITMENRSDVYTNIEIQGTEWVNEPSLVQKHKRNGMNGREGGRVGGRVSWLGGTCDLRKVSPLPSESYTAELERREG